MGERIISSITGAWLRRFFAIAGAEELLHIDDALWSRDDWGDIVSDVADKVVAGVNMVDFIVQRLNH